MDPRTAQIVLVPVIVLAVRSLLLRPLGRLLRRYRSRNYGGR